MRCWALFAGNGVAMADEIYTPDEDRVIQLAVTRGSKPKPKPATEVFADQWRERKLPAFVREYEFATRINRKWRFDFVCVLRRTPKPLKLAVEIEGLVMRRVNGSWQVGGRHGSIKGFKDDCEKYATAAVFDWKLVRFEQSHVRSGYAIDMCVRILASHGWKPKS